MHGFGNHRLEQQPGAGFNSWAAGQKLFAEHNFPESKGRLPPPRTILGQQQPAAHVLWDRQDSNLHAAARLDNRTSRYWILAIPGVSLRSVFIPPRSLVRGLPAFCLPVPAGHRLVRPISLGSLDSPVHPGRYPSIIWDRQESNLHDQTDFCAHHTGSTRIPLPEWLGRGPLLSQVSTLWAAAGLLTSSRLPIPPRSQ